MNFLGRSIPLKNQRLRSWRGTSGFTLIEIVIAMIIVVLLLGITIPSALDIFAHEELRESARDSASAVKAARREAVIQRKDHWLVFDSGRIEVYAFDNLSESILDVEIADGVRCLMKPWLQNDWEKLDGQRVKVSKRGVSEPFSILFRSGEAYISYRFDPLTGGVAEEENYFP